MQIRSTDLSVNVEAPVGWWGIAIAFSIMAIWATSLLLLLFVRIEELAPLPIVFAVWLQTFLYTGVFITAHDAMHRVVCPRHPKLNHTIGKIALLLYGFLPYKQFLKRHWQHHQYPASDKDPDFHDGLTTSLLGWYTRFMLRYCGWRSLISVTICYHSMHYFLHIAHINLILFWACPSILSSFQLFYFGTFLPHREPSQGYTNVFRARSFYFPVWLSLLTCYHFGYHREHHQYPALPWWRLPSTASCDSDSISSNKCRLPFGINNGLY